MANSADFEGMVAAETERLTAEDAGKSKATAPGAVKFPIGAQAIINVLISMFGGNVPGMLLSAAEFKLGRAVVWDGAETWQEKHPKG